MYKKLQNMYTKRTFAADNHLSVELFLAVESLKCE
jgi:hypothetical protein